MQIISLRFIEKEKDESLCVVKLTMKSMMVRM